MSNFSCKTYFFYALLFVISLLISSYFAYWVWTRRLLYAMCIYSLYFSGAFRFLPFKSMFQKALFSGVFCGSLLGAYLYFTSEIWLGRT
jgi:hypothetical protein